MSLSVERQRALLLLHFGTTSSIIRFSEQSYGSHAFRQPSDKEAPKVDPRNWHAEEITK